MRRKFNAIPKLHIKKNDTVMVISGDDKGKTGRVIEVLPKEGKVIVEGVNIVIRHSKPSAQNPEGGRIEKTAPLYTSKVMLVDPKTGKPTRVGRVEKEVNGKTRLVRVNAKSKEEIR